MSWVAECLPGFQILGLFCRWLAGWLAVYAVVAGAVRMRALWLH